MCKTKQPASLIAARVFYCVFNFDACDGRPRFGVLLTTLHEGAETCGNSPRIHSITSLKKTLLQFGSLTRGGNALGRRIKSL